MTVIGLLLRYARRNILALAVAVLPTVVFAVWVIQQVPSESLCKTGDPCVQQWFAALSGWVAAAGAFAAIVISVAIEREKARSEAQKTPRIAEDYLDELRAISELCVRIQTAMPREQKNTSWFTAVSEINQLLRALDALLDSPIVREAPRLLGRPENYRSRGLLRADIAVAIIATSTDLKPSGENFAINFMSFNAALAAQQIGLVVRNCRDFCESAEAYIAAIVFRDNG